MSKTIEEKARAYDKALEKAREYWETDDDNTLDIKARGTMEYLFPELAESEDERIRRLLISGMKNLTRSAVTFASVPIKDVIDWLEKHGKKEFTFKSIPRLLEMIEPTDRAKSYCQKLIDSLVKEGYTADAKIVEACLKQMNGENVAIAVMDKKPVIIIPKFRVGDEVVTKNEESLTITRIDEEGYWSNDLFICGFDDSDEWELVEQKPYGQRKECLDCQFNYAGECKGSCAMKRNEQKPANKKELKKIHVIDEGKAEIDHCFTKMMNGEKVSSTWSEEDEKRLKSCLNILQPKSLLGNVETINTKWLKSIRNRITWKPSDEQMNAFEQAYNWYNTHSAQSLGLNSLYYDLKKLKRE